MGSELPPRQYLESTHSLSLVPVLSEYQLGNPVSRSTPAETSASTACACGAVTSVAAIAAIAAPARSGARRRERRVEADMGSLLTLRMRVADEHTARSLGRRTGRAITTSKRLLPPPDLPCTP